MFQGQQFAGCNFPLFLTEVPMTALLTISSLLAALLALAWSREFRLRRALQLLLARIFSSKGD
jgi:hypothetical protein